METYADAVAGAAAVSGGGACGESAALISF